MTGGPGLIATRDEVVLVVDEIGNVREMSAAAVALLGRIARGTLLLELVGREDRADLYDLLGGRSSSCDATIATWLFRFTRRRGPTGAMVVHVSPLAAAV